MVWTRLAGITGDGQTSRLTPSLRWAIRGGSVDEQENTLTLVRTARLNRCVNIYTAMMAFGLGLLLVTPNLKLPSPGLTSLSRSRCMSAASKNPASLRTHSAVYRGYTASVGRFGGVDPLAPWAPHGRLIARFATYPTASLPRGRQRALVGHLWGR